MNNMLTFDEVKNYLEAEQSEIEKYIRDGVLHAYKIGGVYIRFRKEEVLNLKYDVLLKKKKVGTSISFGQKLWDFWRFNNFYIISVAVIAALVYWFLRTAVSS
ncbi:MAG TPA: helix-turn-helix domain-containing protein [Candidatus Omnitrophota bacterium]|nr:helix-turn-helix domain-containing protein [Candidatus Omnitrophota bacterium]HPS37752.1 helix-turn-helix domain-containing protein [Candidatus Omnitrophota bacterium]